MPSLSRFDFAQMGYKDFYSDCAFFIFGGGSAFRHAAQLRRQYPQKSTLGLFFMTSATMRSTCDPFGSFR
jgi:hypothetical protein